MVKPIESMEMPGKEAPTEEEFDFGFDEEAPESEEGPSLEAFSDEDLIDEMKKRGFEVEDVPEDEGDAPEMEAPEAAAEEEMPY